MSEPNTPPFILKRDVLYGVTHDAFTGEPIIRETRVLKVGIGLPIGKNVHVFINQAAKWVVVADNKEKECSTRLEAEKTYAAAVKNAERRKYPARLPYFTFLRVGQDGDYTHDFDAIETCGPTPTVLDIVFLADSPLSAEMAWYGSSRRQCYGDGINAMRRVELAATPEEKKLAAEATAKHQKFFPIIGGCATRGCAYVHDDNPTKKKVCKRHGRLLFQLLNSPRVGGSVTFDTTGSKSLGQMSSSLATLRLYTERIGGHVAGIPLKMVLRPYKTEHDGKTQTQYAVSIEFPDQDAKSMAKRLIAYANEFNRVITADAIPQIAAGPDEDDPDAEAGIISAEFYPDDEHPDDDEFSEGSEEAREQAKNETLSNLRKAGAAVEEVTPDPKPKTEQANTSNREEPEPEPEPEPTNAPPTEDIEPYLRPVLEYQKKLTPEKFSEVLASLKVSTLHDIPRELVGAALKAFATAFLSKAGEPKKGRFGK